MSWSNKDGRRARIEEAVRKGRCAASEGVPMHMNPFVEVGQREAWLVGYMSIFGERARVIS